jgi:hypothetical protein
MKDEKMGKTIALEKKAGRDFPPPVWDGHPCPSPLKLKLVLDCGLV